MHLIALSFFVWIVMRGRLDVYAQLATTQAQPTAETDKPQ